MELTRGSLAEGADGVLYGTTRNGGVHGLGVLFRLAKTVWATRCCITSEVVPTMAARPLPVCGSRNGALYGTTTIGGDIGKAPSIDSGTDSRTSRSRTARRVPARLTARRIVVRIAARLTSSPDQPHVLVTPLTPSSSCDTNARPERRSIESGALIAHVGG
jgi:uncharacterized repeat protein (TIGR03803 family)